MNTIVKFNGTEYGLTETKAAEVEAAFTPMLKKMTDLEDNFNKVISMEIDENTCAMAKKLRLEYVKVRTGTAKIHKELKAFYLSGGRAVDGWKNAQLHASSGNELKLLDIERYYEDIELERLEAVRVERTAELEKIDFTPEMIPAGIDSMDQDVWNNYLSGAKESFIQRKAAEEKAEAERIAAEEAKIQRQIEIEKENAALKIAADRVVAERKKEQDRAVKNLAEEKALAAKKEREAQAELDNIEAEREKERVEAAYILEKERGLAAEKEKKAKEELEKVELKRREEKEAADAVIAEAKALEEKARQRAADEDLRKKVNSKIADDIIALKTGVTSDQAIMIVNAIAGGGIQNISTTY